MHRLVVDRDADRAWEAVVAEEAGGRPTVADELFGDAVELDRLDPGHARLLQGRKHRREQAARTGHEVDFVGGFEVDHAVFVLTAGAVTATRTCRLMSSIVPMPSISETRFPPR